MRRFTIANNDQAVTPSLDDDMSPEQITIVKKSGKIKGSALPGAYGADESLTDLFEVSGSGDGETKERKGSNSDENAENAANFGSNVIPKPGINPSVAFIATEGNHDGFKGKDKAVGEKTHRKHKKYKKHQSVTKTNSVKSAKKTGDDDAFNKSDHQTDTDIISQIQDIAKQIDAVEKKRDEEKKQEDKLKKEEKMKQKLKEKSEKDAKKQVSLAIDKLQDVDSYQSEKDKSTKNSHGRKKSAATVSKQMENNESLSEPGHKDGANKTEKSRKSNNMKEPKDGKENTTLPQTGKLEAGTPVTSPHGEAGGNFFNILLCSVLIELLSISYRHKSH